MKNIIRTTAFLTAIACGVSPVANARQASGCNAESGLVPVDGLAEASGLALSKRVSGRLWTLNDSGKPIVTALDQKGAITARVSVTGASVQDWEAIAVGPCAAGSCLYIGDIGDNEGKRSRITIYRAPEPEPSATSTTAETFHAEYPDGGHDAETLLIANGRLYIVTKGDTGPIAVYRFPAELRSGNPMKLERVVQLSATPGAAERITDGSVSPDGRWVALRTKERLMLYSSDVLNGPSKPTSTIDLRFLKEPQGEGVALGTGNTVFVAGEGGGKGHAGTFARVSCATLRTK